MPDDPSLAPCGIDCAGCDICKAAQDPDYAVQLAAAWRSWQPNAEPGWFRCRGCRGDRSLRWNEHCRIAACCGEKGLAHCGHCADFPCPPYREWIGPHAHHRTACARLAALRAGAAEEDA